MQRKRKRCFKCRKVKVLEAFYKHSMMADGHLGKCKECAKLDVSANYYAKKERYQEYERMRFKLPERKKQIRIYARRVREKYPEKFRAQNRLRRAVLNGIVQKFPCIICGNPKSEGHHQDYSMPLDVVWLCRQHHMDVHNGKVKI